MYRSYPLCPSNFQTHSNQSSLFSPFYNLGSNQRCVYMVSVESCTVARAPTSGHSPKGKWPFPSRSHRLQVAGRWVPCEPAPPPFIPVWHFPLLIPKWVFFVFSAKAVFQSVCFQSMQSLYLKSWECFQNVSAGDAHDHSRLCKCTAELNITPDEPNKNLWVLWLSGKVKMIVYDKVVISWKCRLDMPLVGPLKQWR